MTQGRKDDATMARDYLGSLANRQPTDPAVLAAAAQAHATLALNDRLATLLEQMMRRSAPEHPAVSADRAWLQQQKDRAVTHHDPRSIRQTTDALNRAVVHDPVVDERMYATRDEIEALGRAEAQIDPDVAASNRQAREAALEQSSDDGAVGVFGQIPAEDG